MRKALFWDFHGTLVVGKSIWTPALCRAMNEFGFQAEEQSVRRHLETGFTWHTPEQPYPDRTGELWWEDLFIHFKDLFASCGVPSGLGRKLCLKAREEILAIDNYKLYEDAVDVLTACQDAGFTNYVVSNNYPDLSELIDRLGLRKQFEGCIVSAEVGYEKPHPEIFRRAFIMAGHPGFCCMIGDNPDADVGGAVAAGIPAILVHQETCPPYRYAAKTLSEIPDLLSELCMKK